MRIIRVTVERAPRRRVWLRAVDNTGHVEIVQNIRREEATRERNLLLERLTASGLYDEVIGEPVNGSRKGNNMPEDTTYELKCSACSYSAVFENERIAETAAEMHVMLGPDHRVTCTRPAHFHQGAVPVIVFEFRKEKK